MTGSRLGTVADMSESEKDIEQTEGIDDEQLPEDLRPSEENPLARPLDPDDEDTPDPEELDVLGGKPAEEWDDEDLED